MEEGEKYKKVVEMLRNSRPGLKSTGDIEREVMKRIQKRNPVIDFLHEAVEFIFGWVYIGWVRRSLITLSIVLVLIFVYQQGTILRRIDMLSRQLIIKNNINAGLSADEIEKLLTIYKSSGRKIPSKTIDFSERQMNELLESLDDLRIKYKDLEELIENDPDLKKLIEEKLMESNKTKINL
jgi:hypothetical protein